MNHRTYLTAIERIKFVLAPPDAELAISHLDRYISHAYGVPVGYLADRAIVSVLERRATERWAQQQKPPFP